MSVEHYSNERRVQRKIHDEWKGMARGTAGNWVKDIRSVCVCVCGRFGARSMLLAARFTIISLTVLYFACYRFLLLFSVFHSRFLLYVFGHLCKCCILYRVKK